MVAKYVAVEVDLDEFDDDDILEAANEILRRRTSQASRTSQANIEALYYATRGTGPIGGDTADAVRALIAEMAGRYT